MLKTICDRWWVLLLRGLAAIAFGICAIMLPGITLVTLVWMFAAFSIVEGILEIVLGIRGEADGTIWWTMLLLGVLAIAAGIIAFAWPGLTLFVLTAVIAAYAIVRGVFEIAAAIRLRHEIDDEWMLGLAGLMSIIFGGLILWRPDAGLLAIALLIGAYALAIGVFNIAMAMRFRRMGRKLAAAT
jgi:uncharacterized membrane protein HdeD (DUF308 family)